MCSGCCRAAEREAVKRAAATDPALAAEIEGWNEQLSPLLLDAPEVEPPAYLFDRIKAAIAESAKPQASANDNLAGSRTVRAFEGRWEQLCPGIERKTLWHDREKGRITFLIRAQPGAQFPAHHHDDDEEAYVLSGDLELRRSRAQCRRLSPRAPRRAPSGRRSKGGCMLLVTAAA